MTPLTYSIPSLHIHAWWHFCRCLLGARDLTVIHACWHFSDVCWGVMWLSCLRSKTPDPNGPKGMSHGESRALKMMFPEVVPGSIGPVISKTSKLTQPTTTEPRDLTTLIYVEQKHRNFFLLWNLESNASLFRCSIGIINPNLGNVLTFKLRFPPTLIIPYNSRIICWNFTCHPPSFKWLTFVNFSHKQSILGRRVEI